MKEDNPPLHFKEALEIRIPTQERNKIDAAFERIYERYGDDLPAFFRDAYHEVTQQAMEKCVRRNSED